MAHFSEQNFYEILEVAPEATSEEIQKAFHKAKSTYSPNSPALYSVFSEDEAKELLKLIDEAYAVLSNHAKRREYDKSVFGKSSAETVATVVPFKNNDTSSMTDLPDFMLPESEAPQEVVITKTQITSQVQTPVTPAASVSTLSGKTIISHFNVQDDFEEEIKNQTVFDGTFLQKVRHYKNISLDQLSETSRISRSYLIAIETNDFHALPAAVYVRGFISSVARLLGLKEKPVVDSFMKLYKDSRGG